MMVKKNFSLGGNMSLQSSQGIEKQPLPSSVTLQELHSKPENPLHTETSNVAKKALTHRTRRKEKMPPTDDITSDLRKTIFSSKEMVKRTSSQTVSSKVKPHHFKPKIVKTGLSQTQMESGRTGRSFELVPRDFKYTNFSTPVLTKLQRSNLMDYEIYSNRFTAAVSALYSQNSAHQPATKEQIEEINKYHSDMQNAAKKIVNLIQAELSIVPRKSKEISIDFLYELRLVLEKSPFLTKFESELKIANHDLKDFLMINFTHCRQDNRVKMFFPELDLEIEKGKNPELEKKKKELEILHHYRKVMLELAKNLDRIGKSYTLPEDDDFSVQAKTLKHLEKILSKLFQALHNYDPDENELKKIIEIGSPDSYKRLIYTSLSKVIITQVLEIYWTHANKQAQMDLIQFRTEELKKANKRHALFCWDCLDEFDKSLKHQKYHDEVLIDWRRMFAGGWIIHIDKARNVLLEPKKIPEPDDPNDLEKMQRYSEELNDYNNASMALLSKYAFNDETLLDNFLKTALRLSREWMPELPKPNDPLEMHARIFHFLENVLTPLPENNEILLNFNKALFQTNKVTILQLEQKARSNTQTCSGVEMTISFMLSFYRALNHKYIMVPISNLEQMYKLAYSSQPSIFKKSVNFSKIQGTDIDKEILQPARRIYFFLGDAHFEVHSVRADEIDPGPGIDETYCLIYTYTSIRIAYPAELGKYTHSIEFSYQRVKPQDTAKSPEKILAIESAMDENLRRLGLLIEAAGFPKFVERFAEPTT